MATAGRNDNDEIEEIVLPKSKKKLFIVILIVVLLLSGIGAGVYYFLFQTPAAESDAGEATAGTNADAAKKDGKGKPPVFLALESFTVNLKTAPDEGQQYLQIGMTLELRSDRSVDPIKQRIPQVRNRVLMLLTNSKASDLATSEGKEKLVEEIKTQINAMYPQMINDAPVFGVFFTSFIIQ
jgi:flagellar FliL protein